MLIPGKRVQLTKWIHGRLCVLRVQVEGVIPDGAGESEPCLEPPAVRLLDELQRLADAGRVDELGRHGDVYVRKSA